MAGQGGDGGGGQAFMAAQERARTKQLEASINRPSNVSKNQPFARQLNKEKVAGAQGKLGANLAGWSRK